MKKLFVIICLLTTAVAFSAGTQNPDGTNGRYRFRHIGNEEGLKYTWISDIEQDGKGYLWFSTMFGAYRYDGYEFEEYTFEDNMRGIAANVNLVREDSSGKLWFGTNDGLYCHDPRYNTYARYHSGGGGEGGVPFVFRRMSYYVWPKHPTAHFGSVPQMD